MTPKFIIQYLKKIKSGMGIIHLDYEKSFPSLWKSLEESSFEKFLVYLKASKDAQRCHVWIVWQKAPNDTTTSPVATSDYLTPLDWATCVANKYPGQVQVTVIDMNSDGHEDLPTCQIYSHCDKKKFSWLRVIPILDLPFENKQIPFCSHPSSIPPSFFVETIKHNLTQTSAVADHHAISNIVGPMVLLGKGYSQTRTDRNALTQLMQSVGLVRKGTGNLFPWFPKEQWIEKVEKIVLLDDMHELGWAEFLRRALGIINDDNHLLAFDNIEDKGITKQGKTLIALLEEKFPQGECANGLNQMNNAGLTLCGEEKVILFLDLRLFTMSGSGERAFLQRLVGVAKHVPDNLKLPWPQGGFSKEELNTVEQWASSSEKGITSPAYYTALTLLPRLLAIADPMLPIVIFSTAGQPETVKALQHCGNIILDFHKPRFFGDASDMAVAEETKERFVRAMRQAVALAHGRKLCRPYLVHDAPENESSVPSQQSNNKPVVEIYIDESGSADNKKFGVGGLLAVYPSEASIATFQEKLPNYGYTRDGGTLTFLKDHRIKEPQNPNVEEPKVMQTLQTAATSLSVILSAFFVQEKHEFPSTTSSEVDDLTNPFSLDNRYRHLLRVALEMALFECLPHHLEISGVQIKNLQPECRIYAATRYLPTKHNDSKKSQERVQNFERYHKDFGVDLKYREDIGIQGCYLLSDNDIYPIVAEVKRRRKTSDFHPKIITARATQLAYFCEPETRVWSKRGQREQCPTHEGFLKKVMPRTQDHVRMPRRAHYLADIVCRWASQKRNPYPQSFALLFEKGFNTQVEYSNGWLEASRAADNGQWVDAIIATETAKAITESAADKFSFSRYVQPKIKVWVKNLKGPDFIELCRRLEIDKK